MNTLAIGPARRATPNVLGLCSRRVARSAAILASVLLAAGCANSAHSTTATAPSQAAPATAPSAAPTSATVPATPAAAQKPPAILPSWWTRPAPTLDGKATLIAQADATEAPAAREAAIAEAKRRLEAQGADLSGFEIMQQQVTKVRFDGPYRAFVMVAAPKAK
ncbi:MAG: hypothetical protein SFY96_02610 [Planctomycetota bacterium]|nr:hypothetical protein [Planctomycetota bacterium]